MIMKNISRILICITCLSVMILSGVSAQDTPSIQSEASDRFTLNFSDVDIREVIRAVGLAQGANIIADRDVSGSVTIYLNNVNLETALDALTKPNGFIWSKEGELYRIQMMKENPFVLVRNRKLTLHADNVELGAFLDAVSRATKMNLITTEKINKNITAHLTNVSINDGITRALRTNGLNVTKENKSYRVSPAKPPVEIEKREDGKIILNAKGADIRTVFTRLGKLTRNNIVLDKNVAVTNVTFYVEQVEFLDILEALTSTYGLAWQKTGNLFRIYRPQAGVQLPVSIDKDNRVSFELRGAELGQIVAQIARRMGWNSAFYVGLSERVNQRVDRVPVEDVLNMLFENTAHAWKLDTSTEPSPTLLVGNPSLGSRESHIFLIGSNYALKYIKASEAMSFLPREIPSGNVKVMGEQNVLHLSGTQKMHQLMKKLVARIDTAPRQIEIEMLVLEVNREKAKNLGMGSITAQRSEVSGSFSPVGAPNISFTVTQNGTLGQQFATSLTALEREGVVTIKAKPTIMVKSGQTASISVSREDNFQIIAPSATPNVPVVQIKSIPSGITLNITPWSGASGEIIHLTISGEVSSASGQVSGTQLPTVSSRRANTQVAVVDGQTIVIGGLIQTRENDTSDGIPILKNLPFLKHVFGNTSKSTSSTELIFYITPRIVDARGIQMRRFVNTKIIESDNQEIGTKQ